MTGYDVTVEGISIDVELSGQPVGAVVGGELQLTISGTSIELQVEPDAGVEYLTAMRTLFNLNFLGV